MYAILDIETTGGQFDEEGITEIAIYRFDGHQITDQFISLVNPEIPIQPFVVKLTGISNEMLRTAPKFFEVAKRIIEITSDCIIVAHNTTFDYRILRTEFKRLGFDFQAQTLCTVELAQKLLPEQPAYSLGKLVRALGIPMADRHRATGDAMATLKLFKLLLLKDSEKQIVRELIKTEIEKGIEPKLLDIVEGLPSQTGIYYIHREDGSIIYISKSRNIKRSVNQHFVSNARLSMKIQAEAYSVTFEETGSELIASLKEAEEIRINRPPLSRGPKRSRFYPWTITMSTNADGFRKIELEKTPANRKDVGLFSSFQEGKNAMFRITSDYKLCLKINGLYEGDGHCPNYPERCDGACHGEITTETYNERVQAFANRTSIDNRSIVIIDKGRNIAERSAIIIEHGMLKGYAFFDLNYQVSNLQVLQNILIPMNGSKELITGIRSYIMKNRRNKIVSF